MLKVENLTKVYTRGKTSVTALNNVSFTLAQTGFVFIIGKSGCGKSTLLNMIGGLDNLTAGDIICDGNRLSQFKNSDFDKYRNTYLGFVFQDYCLIDDLNVFQNIELALDLKGETLDKKTKTEKIENALKSVDLDVNIKNRYVKELSGGQKQRVAIARALIKDPRLILADEPTGNLDSKTSEKILNTLKNLSKDRLVLIVSHNLDDAKKYADRIIELADGEIKSDTTRDVEESESLTLRKGVLTLPHSTTLSKQQLKEINESLDTNKIKKVKQHGSGFKKTKEHFVDTGKIDIEPQKMSISSASRLARHFIKKRVLASFITVFVVTLLVFILGMCQFFIQFDEANTVYAVLQENNEESLLIYNGYYDEDDQIIGTKYIEIPDTQIEEFENSGYTGNIYKLYVNPFCFSENFSESGRIVPMLSMGKYYIYETRGTLVCDEDYLIRRFGKDGKLDYIGDLTDKSNGIIITDYIADSLIYHKSRSSSYDDYESILGRVVVDRLYVNAIIKTDYKEKYADFFDYIDDISIGIDRDSEKEHYHEVMRRFVMDVQKHYGVAYSIVPDYIEQLKNDYTSVHRSVNYGEFKVNNIGLSFDNIYTYERDEFEVPIKLQLPSTPIFKDEVLRPEKRDELVKVNETKYLNSILTTTYKLKENEIAIEYDIFNTLFGKVLGYYTEETYQDFEPITITLNRYDGTDEENIVFSKEITIALLTDTSALGWTNEKSNAIMCGEELMDFFAQYSCFVYGLYLEDASQLDKVYNIIESHPYIVQSRVYDSISLVGYIVEIFEDLFWLILLTIGGISILLLVSYAYGNIKKRFYEIGVLKSIGATTKNVGFIFSMQTILAGVLISILSTIMLLSLCGPINNIISNELLKFINNRSLSEILVIQINAPTLLINIGIILLLTVLSCLIPILRLNKIKPKNIIASDEK